MSNRNINVAAGTAGLRAPFPEAVDCVVDSNDNNFKYMGTDGVVRSLASSNIGGSGSVGREVSAIAGLASTAGVGNGADATDDVLFTANLPAGALSGGSGQQRAVLTGTVTFAGNVNTKTLKFKFGATPVVITLNPTTTAPNAKVLSFWIEVAFVSATAQVITAEVGISGNAQELISKTNATEVGANALAMTITGASGSSAANDVLLGAAELSFYN